MFISYKKIDSYLLYVD